MKTKIILFLLCLVTLNVMGQNDGINGTIHRQTCKTCGKPTSQCPYKGKHPKEKKCSTCGKLISKCPHKGKHPKPHPTEKTCSTCGKVLSKCPYNGSHPTSEAAGHIVFFSSNVPSATIYIDGNNNGTATGVRVLKTGSHTIKLTASGYEDYTDNITVSMSSNRRFYFSMKQKRNAVTTTEKTFTVNGVSFTMMPVQGGTFTMGATSEQGSDAESDEKPTHQVTLSSYYIGKYEVTQALWQAVTGSNPSKFKGDNLPVEEVSWDDCQAFIRELNRRTGKTFRLPTEAEWEYAARGGRKSQGYKYSGSDNIDNVAWYDGNSGSKTHPVGTKSPNELGLYDMSGNVWEWCSDWKGDYGSSSQTNPTGPSSGSSRVNRGGSWGSYARYCRSSNRSGITPDCRGLNLGLRLALSE